MVYVQQMSVSSITSFLLHYSVDLGEKNRVNIILFLDPVGRQLTRLYIKVSLFQTFMIIW